MPGAAHDTIVIALKQKPEWLDALLRFAGYEVRPATYVVADSALRMVDPVEVRPDAVLAEESGSAWRIVEVQRDPKDERGRRWLVAAALLLDDRGTMGDVIIVTHRRAVARWGNAVAEFSGPSGTKLLLRPVVICLDASQAEALLERGPPELALFAAWAVHDQRGAKAKKIVRRAMARAGDVEEPLLRRAVVRNILNVLEEPLAAMVRKMVMDPNQMPESPWFRELRLELEAKGRAEGRVEGRVEGRLEGEVRALLRLLERRGIGVDEDSRSRIEACTDVATLENWIDRAVTASSVRELFEP